MIQLGGEYYTVFLLSLGYLWNLLGLLVYETYSEVCKVNICLMRFLFKMV
jgi:hypothetical protein